MKKLILISALFAGIAQAAVPTAALRDNYIAPPVAVNAAPNEVLGMLVCRPTSPTQCGEMKNFVVEETNFADYVRAKTNNPEARIVGLQYDPPNSKLYIYFAMPE